MATRARAAITLLTGLLLVGGVTAPGAAAAAPALPPPGGYITGPEPAPSEPFDLAAGEACDFPVHAEPVVDDVQVISFYDAFDRLVKQFYFGTLVDEITNTTTGATTRVDLSADALFVYGRDGSTTIYGAGPYLVVFYEGDTPGPSVQLIDGLSKVTIAADGTRELVFASRHQDLCERID